MAMVKHVFRVDITMPANIEVARILLCFGSGCLPLGLWERWVRM